jgi:hypothetical protein
LGGSPLNLPITLAGTGGKNMILATVQLLRIALEPGLATLILISLVVALIIASSIASPLKPSILTMVPLEPGACEVPL